MNTELGVGFTYLDVGDVCEEGLVLAERADAHAVRLVADCGALEEDVVRAGLYRDCIVAVEDDTVLDCDVVSLRLAVSDVVPER